MNSQQAEKHSTASTSDSIFPIVGLGIWALFALGMFLPEGFWGFNAAACLSPMLGWSILLISAAFIALPFLKNIPFPPQIPTLGSNNLIFVSVGMGVIYYAFSIKLDAYGDAAYIIPQINYEGLPWDMQRLWDLFNFPFTDTKIGTLSFYASINFLSAALGISGLEAVSVLSAACGLGFSFFWLKMVWMWIEDSTWRWAFALMVLTAPCTVFFFGQAEIYAIPMLTISLFLYVLSSYLQTKKLLYLWLLIPAFLLALKGHITSYVLLLPMALAFIDALGNDQMKRVFEWKMLGLVIGLPILLIGAWVYFGLTDSAFADRDYLPTEFQNYIFLPIQATDGAPLNRYNLLSFNHLWDYFNLIFFWSPIAVFFLILPFAFHPKKIQWQQNGLMMIGITAALYLLLFFVLNPLLSMPVDRDLFSLPALPLFLFVLILVKEWDKHPQWRQSALSISLGLGLLSISFFVVNIQDQANSKRLEFSGKHEFKTYWKGCSTSILGGIEMDEDSLQQIKRLDQVLADLERYAVKGNDLEYAALLHKRGFFHYQNQQFEEALPYFQQAFDYKLNLSRNVFYLVVSHFMLEEFEEANQYTNYLVQVAYPDTAKANRIAIHVALEAQDYESADKYCIRHLQQYPKDIFIQKVLGRLRSKEELDKIVLMFRRG